MELRLKHKGLVAEIRILADQIDNVKISDITKILEANKILEKYIDHKKIENIVNEKRAGVFLEVARGENPVDGEDGYFDLYFSNEQLQAKPPKHLEDGSVDHHDLNYVDLCYKNDLLMKLFPPTNALPGTNVLGSPVQGKDGLPPPVFLGDNLLLSDDGLFVMAAEDGYALYDFDKNLNVFTTLEINSDIDYSVGNISFPGDVVINGDVMNGFTIKSGSNITIEGSVESANLVAANEICVNGGINQKHGGKVQADIVRANVVHFGNIEANKIYILLEILYSNLKGSHLIDVSGEDSRVIGGHITCNGKFLANDIGSRKEASKTHIYIKQDEVLTEKLAEVEAEFEKIKSEHEKVSAEIREIENYLSQPNISPSEFHEFEGIYERYQPKELNLSKQVVISEKKKNELIEEIAARENPELHVLGYLYGGVELAFDTQTLSNTLEKKSIKIFEEHKIVRFFPLKPKKK